MVLSIQLICTAYFSEREKYARLAEINATVLRELVHRREQLILTEKNGNED